ncbi:MAG: DNA repair protein RecN [Betaproteobacteria bacterium]
MLRTLSIRNFVVVETLDVDFADGFTVLTGETGAGKSILLDALGLLLGDRFEQRQLRPGAERAELSAQFDLAADAAAQRWLADAGLDAGAELLLRRVHEAQGRSRAWINGRPATLAQLAALGECLLDLHGQHAHQSLTGAEAQRALLDAFGASAPLARDVNDAWRAWRDAVDRRDAAAAAAGATEAERETLDAAARELAAFNVGPSEWGELEASQRRLANAASLIDATSTAEQALADGDDALARRLVQLLNGLRQASSHDATLMDVVALLEPASIQIDEASRALRDYTRRLDLDPNELERIERRLSAIHDMARKHRTRPDGLFALAGSITQRLDSLAATDTGALAEAAAVARGRYDAAAATLTVRRAASAKTLSQCVTAAMQDLAMSGGRFDVVLEALGEPASFGRERVAFLISTHPKQPAAPLSRVASGGELARVALAIEVAASDVGNVPTLVFDEVDTGIGGAVAATVGRLLQRLGERRQVLCVTHLPQVAAHADHHYRVVKTGTRTQVSSELSQLSAVARVDELARMLAGTEITVKTRAHARELFDQHRRPAAPRADGVRAKR